MWRKRETFTVEKNGRRWSLKEVWFPFRLASRQVPSYRESPAESDW